MEGLKNLCTIKNKLSNHGALLKDNQLTGLGKKLLEKTIPFEMANIKRLAGDNPSLEVLGDTCAAMQKILRPGKDHFFTFNKKEIVVLNDESGKQYPNFVETLLEFNRRYDQHPDNPDKKTVKT